jgi:opacity protein-like surface antigen
MNKLGLLGIDGGVRRAAIGVARASGGLAATAALLIGAWGTGSFAATNYASDEVLPTVTLEPRDTDLKNRVGIAYQMGMNIGVDFRKFGGLFGANPGPASGSAVDRNYDNGYNRVDEAGNAGGKTWYWGYSSPNSVQGDSLVLQSESTPANASSNGNQDNPQHGFEIFYQRELVKKEHWRAGLEAAFGMTFISIRDTSTLHNRVYRTNDNFALGGVIPPQPSYSGTFTGPGPLIDSAPSDRTQDFVNGAATITGERKLDSTVYMFRLGPYIEVPINQRVSIFGDAGLALVVGDSKFSFNEQVAINDPSAGISITTDAPRHGSGSKTDFLVGGYVGGGLTYSLTREIALIGSVKFQGAGRSIDNTKGKESILDLGQSILVSVGVTYAF